MLPRTLPPYAPRNRAIQKLLTWMNENLVHQSELSRRTGIHYSSLSKLLCGHRVAGPKTRQTIVSVTKGAVREADFFLPPRGAPNKELVGKLVD